MKKSKEDTFKYMTLLTKITYRGDTVFLYRTNIWTIHKSKYFVRGVEETGLVDLSPVV